jgi:hypothetical protein
VALERQQHRAQTNVAVHQTCIQHVIQSAHRVASSWWVQIFVWARKSDVEISANYAWVSDTAFRYLLSIRMSTYFGGNLIHLRFLFARASGDCQLDTSRKLFFSFYYFFALVSLNLIDFHSLTLPPIELCLFCC